MHIILTWVEIWDTPTNFFGVLESALHKAISAGIISVEAEEFFVVKIALSFVGTDSSSTVGTVNLTAVDANKYFSSGA